MALVSVSNRFFMEQSTTWVRKESEAEEKRLAALKVASADAKGGSGGRCWMRVDALKLQSREMFDKIDKTQKKTWAAISPKFRKGC